MKIAGMQEIQSKSAELLGGDEPILVTRQGRVSGVYLPLDEPDRLPADIRLELASVLGKHFSRILETQDITEEKLSEDFRAYRKDRR